MDIDKLFKLPPPRPGAGTKRKLPDKPSEEALKRFRVAEEEQSDKPQPVRNVTVEDEDEVVGPARPEASVGEVDEGDDDDEGRFFGGGLNDEQNQILDIFDKAGDAEDEDAAMTVPALRRLLGRFERTVTKNAEQRGKFPDDPTKFIDSESDLDAMLKQFLPLTQNPALYYPELVNTGTIGLLANLLSHENTDIAVDVVEVLQELTDEDVGNDEAELDGDGNEEAALSSAATRLALAQLVDVLLENSIFELLVANLKRLDESEDSDRQGVFQILGIFENLLSFMPPLADQVGSSTDILAWLLERMLRPAHDSNRQYAAEILSILLQSSPANIDKLISTKGIDSLLRILSQYRGRDPVDGEEEEFMEDSFNSLCCLVGPTEGKRMFLEEEGVELMVLIMKEKRIARSRAAKVLDYAMQTEAGSANCERFVEMLGLKTFFSLFMGKNDHKKKRQLALTFEDNEHLLGILVSLFTNLASDTPPRIRLIAKFVEENYEKVDRLLEMRESAQTRLKSVNAQIDAERKGLELSGEEIDEDQEDEWYLNRLSAGLAALQAADYVLAWVAMEDDGIRAHAERLLGRKGSSLQDVAATLKEMSQHVDVEEKGAEDDAAQQKLILDNLVTFLTGN